MHRPRLTSSAFPLASVCALAVAATVVAGFADDDGKPPIFTDITLATAIERNADDGRILVIKATAVWCGPCKRMDATTWREEQVVEWFREKGVALSLDVDEHREDAQRLRIRAMPTLVAFRGGEEVHRVVGYQSGDGLLEWLAAVERGETASSRLAQMMEAPREGAGALRMQERMGLASELAGAGRYAEAVDEYAWLWENMVRVEPQMAGVRRSFLVREMQRLAATNEQALVRFTELRDVAGAGRDRRDRLGRAGRSATDWVTLNQIIGDEAATLAWFDEIASEPDAGHRLSSVEQWVIPLLEREGRWADLGRIESAPLERLAEEAASMERMSMVPTPPRMDPNEAAELRENSRRFAVERLRTNAARIHASLLAAGRTDEAGQVADEALRLEAEDPERMAQQLVATAVRVGVATEAHRDLLLTERPLTEAARARFGDELPEEHSDAARTARRAAAIEALERALGDG